MIIIPLSGKLSWRNPPLVTIAIILINCLVYFGFQLQDEANYHLATRFYLEELANFEVPRYLNYLKTAGVEHFPVLPPGKDKTRLLNVIERMESDSAFQNLLRSDRVISPRDPQYGQWKGMRKIYEQKLERVTFLQYGFIPARPSLLTALSHMFLHGGFMHLLGNMVFLWLVGCVLELGCGKISYFAGYIASGLLAVGLFTLAYSASTEPLVGASGAISGLMGAYAVLYGKKKIKIFYSVGFYFNYTKVRAFLVLPLWIANEIFQLAFTVNSHVAYMAHIGGLTGGALLAFLNLKLMGGVDHGAFEENRTEEIQSLLEEALGHIGRLNMRAARPVLEKVLEIEPNNREALLHLFNIDKLTPEDGNFGPTAEKLFLNLIGPQGNCKTLRETYTQYCRLARKPVLSQDLRARISLDLSMNGYPEEAEKIMAGLMQTCPEFQMIPVGILNVCRGYLKKGLPDKAEQCLKVLCKYYPKSPEYQMTARLLKQAGT